MANLNEISVLRKLPLKPAIWRIEQQENGDFRLAYSYLKISAAEWQYVKTRRGKIKEYKTAGTCLGDIARVQTKAVIHAVLNPSAD